ncbi:outer membrane beta-barrel protein [Ulvibacter litoralis]|uniref:Outer membrane receptor proteins, mostly Fe transport n=1 Tax=Ulvibacter litoralis TaxID=227084 RepID=A0A1G7DBG4_9FLAO|nr:outer membrane beta-barrel family protein [Ulvibacter litoralis]GHC44164.1 TonB-dependent receptor [Ulvibacter litoralis]SDE48882.1 Outer membrane receptor proteins, mostly Fe transport [Ulvibacter litoralis]
MKKNVYYILLFLVSTAFSQETSISGTVLDSESLPLSFVNVLLFEQDATEPFKGVTTEEDGTFQLTNVAPATYKITFSFIGFTTKEQLIEVVSEKKVGKIKLEASAEALDEAVVVAKKPTLQKTAGKLIFNVENTALSVGSTFDLLKKTPGVLVVGDEIKIKFSHPVIYINGKRVYLSSSEVISLLENLDASAIKSVEVITNPSAKYDADAGAVLNIITSRAVSVGYKGSVTSRYEQAVYAKYNLGTSHFYKNNWVNFYGSYNFSPRKEFKDDDNHIRYFNPDGSTNSFWESNFNRTTRSKAHQATIIADFNLAKNQTLGVTANMFVSPNMTFHNTGLAEIYNGARALDSTFTTLSAVENDKSNLAFNVDYKIELDKEGSTLKVQANYIDYDSDQVQDVATDYFLPNGDFLRNSTFLNNSSQKTNIITSQADLTTNLVGGTFEAGMKFTDTDTKNVLDFLAGENSSQQFNESLSDDFDYHENVYAEYVNYAKDWDKWSFSAGLRGEYTHIDAVSKSLGEVETQKYFELFPTVNLTRILNKNSNLGVSYKRAISRPHYSSLNPFKYFITENNYNGGNPNLVPSIESTITISYDYKSKWFFELYYQNLKNSLSQLTFQDNDSRLIRNLESNLIKDFQYSLDIVFADSLKPWWYFHFTTSSFYMQNEFYSEASVEETYSNNTLGFYGSLYNSFTLSKKQNLTANLTSVYVSNLIFGAYNYKNQFNTSISFRKSFWDKRASITVGVDDIFDTNNAPVISNYYNQDNGYFARAESRLFRLGFTYNFGNARLRDNNRSSNIEEGNRL